MLVLIDVVSIMILGVALMTPDIIEIAEQKYEFSVNEMDLNPWNKEKINV